MATLKQFSQKEQKCFIDRLDNYGHINICHEGANIFLQIYPAGSAVPRTLSPRVASGRDSLCISMDLTSVVSWLGAKVTTMPCLMTPVSTRPTGTVPIPPIL